MKSEIEKIAKILRRTFDKGAWYGPSVQTVLSEVTSENAHHRHANTHSIIELVAHMTSWRRYVISRLKNGPYLEISDEMNFPNETDWIKVKTDLEQSQAEMISLVEILPVEKLDQLVPQATHAYTYYTLLHGIVHHDIYHTGQISLILKANA
jgi:uncharacterized damage-inducible protein DinB